MRAARREPPPPPPGDPKPAGKLHARLADLYEELAHTHRQLSFADAEGDGKAERPRTIAPRPRPDFKVIPSELDRERARKILRAKGYIK